MTRGPRTSRARTGPYLPAHEVAAVLVRQIADRQLLAADVDQRAGYSRNANKTRAIISGKVVRVDVGVAEKLLRAAGSELVACPSWVTGDLTDRNGSPVKWEHILHWQPQGVHA